MKALSEIQIKEMYAECVPPAILAEMVHKLFIISKEMIALSEKYLGSTMQDDGIKLDSFAENILRNNIQI